ncbi:MAG: acyl-CoA dehydrogenase family protein [Armatimonadota bacterium]|nr:acyl-CoA dehydrogenase family protein [Armatimonadota bacterium]MDR7485948.1 acyl-CoA dehydrogenase family protein [Armatimonadota bacterium]MDR7532174.1 acyl-CoA dehydrogenase family protein [Armatimonadota bacterium]MDR7537290.1 acyl-CoA dehydrogenase family protein [Armatimonadota bacterium]
METGTTHAAQVRTPGGGFLLGRTAPEAVFTPEDLTDEQRLVRRTAQQFVEDEVLPHTTALEQHDWALTRRLIRRAGELGFLGADIPEAYGGSGLDKITGLAIKDAMGIGMSFSVSIGAHIGIGTLPIAFFGTEAQKRRYLPGLAAGTLIGAYALTEPTAGSDAMAIRTRATRAADGGFVLDGTKQFISNAAFADVFTVFAKVDGEHHTAFIVERATPGLTVGPEEHKLGIRGSSTAPLILEGVRVPAEGVLGEIGQGHKIAFNILNVGRFTLAAGVTGAARHALRQVTDYARARRQFNKALVEFGLIRQKLARLATAIYVTESMVYRTGGLIADALGAQHQEPAQVMAALEEYAVECSINKVHASEMLDLVVDEMVQIYGGYGFIEDYPAARAYRDARINRIFEGTNEINRLLIPGMLFRRAMKGRLDLLGAARTVADEMLAPAGGDGEDRRALDEERRLVDAARKATLFAAGAAAQTYLTDLEQRQELLGWIADLVIETFAVESAVLRAAKAAGRGDAAADLHAAMVRLALDDALPRMEATARRILAATAQGDALRTMLAGLRRFLKVPAIDTVPVGRQVAQAVIAAGGYPV